MDGLRQEKLAAFASHDDTLQKDTPCTIFGARKGPCLPGIQERYKLPNNWSSWVVEGCHFWGAEWRKMQQNHKGIEIVQPPVVKVSH